MRAFSSLVKKLLLFRSRKKKRSSSLSSTPSCVLRLASSSSSSSAEKRDILQVISERGMETREKVDNPCHPHAQFCFPTSGSAAELQIYAVTWNMNGQIPADGFAELLEHGKGCYDVYIVGLQEAPSYSMRQVFLRILGKHYISLVKTLMGSIHLYVFVKASLHPHISEKRADKVKFRGLGGIIGRQKGAVAASFHIGASSFLFIASHFAAHRGNLKERNVQYMRTRKKIFSGTNPCIRSGPSVNDNGDNVDNGVDIFDSTDSACSVQRDWIDECDVVVWLGDLNYRIEGSRRLVKSFLKYDLEKLLWKRDQLFNQVDKGQVFNGFVEGPLVFKPTYKYDAGTNNYDTSDKARVPSWTDRILIKVKEGSPVSLDVVDYDSIDTLLVSDHRPVKAVLHFSSLEHCI